ncbi:hypothetical protein LX15_003830 [Streptoalloteichus tenebrarius]|uniref:Uncharacterized protein n=1 Tax=Streptoalloteichus tenebrarius (strain ATCC 17920 / DSM 40477 / JCM 4838 / CBS 697.72 / NBRC 16177 / NCIMB 11028 / NRRL B-12390 / A12253. 1 / ISP 5477) TaxID=1933 RepID=A0ABT1HX88_STRSD|nr:hypothetical protein [Streptoalloteichus tenebrarius]MCP2260119.1 hypothetical protein [Streptoalloteichus tenebrarius]
MAAFENAREHAVEALRSAERAEAAAREEERKHREEAAKQSGGGDHPDLTSEEERLLYSMGGPDLVQEYREGLAGANKSILQFLKEVGAEVLLEVTGINDLKKCFGEGNIASCVWTVVNAASLVLIIAKLPSVAAAIGRVIGGVAKFLEGTSWGRRILENGRRVIGEARVACSLTMGTAGNSHLFATASANPTCPRFSVDSNGEIVDLVTPKGRIELPKNLDGGTAQEVGNRIWGGHGPKIPRELIGKRGPEELRRAATKQDAQRLQDFYRWVEINMPNNPTAPSRVKLCQEVIDAWGG